MWPTRGIGVSPLQAGRPYQQGAVIPGIETRAGSGWTNRVHQSIRRGNQCGGGPEDRIRLQAGRRRINLCGAGWWRRNQPWCWRLGACPVGSHHPRKSNIMLRKDVALDALASLNINPRLVIGDGSAVREAFRQMYPTIVAIGRIVSAELSRALDTTVEIDFSDLAAQDVTARARAYASYVGAGMPAELAAANAGVMET